MNWRRFEKMPGVVSFMLIKTLTVLMKGIFSSFLFFLCSLAQAQDWVPVTDSLVSQFRKYYTTQPDSAQLIIEEFQTLALEQQYLPAKAYQVYLEAKLASRVEGQSQGIALYGTALETHRDLLAQDLPDQWRREIMKASTRRAMDAGAAYISAGEFDKSLIEFRRAASAAEQIPDSSRLASANGRIGASHFYLGEQDSAAYYIEREKAIAIAAGDIRIISTALRNLSIIYRGKGEFAKALASLQEGKDALEEMEESRSRQQALAVLNSGLGSLFFMRDDYDQAKAMYLQAYDVYIDNHDVSTVPFLYEMGDIYKSLEQYDSSIYYYSKSLELARELEENVEVIYLHSRLSDLYFDMGQFELSEAYVDSGLVGQKVKQLAFEGFFLNKGKARLLLRKNDTGEALKFAKKAQSWSDSLGVNLELDKEINELLYQIYKRAGNLDMALAHHESFKELNDSLRSEAQTQEFTIVDQEHKAEKERLGLIAEQEKKELALNSEIQQQRIIQYGALAGLGLVCLLAMSFYRSYKIKQSDNARIIEQADQLVFKNDQLQELSNFKEGLTHMIAHDMKNSLNVILGLSENESEEKMKQIHQSGGQLLRMVLNMLDIQKFEEAQIHLNPSEHSVQQLVSEAMLQVELLAHSEGLVIDRGFANHHKVLCNEDLIVRVLVNLLTNAIKYSKGQQKVKISVKEGSDASLAISIQDFGAGIHPDDLKHVFEKFWQTNAMKSGKVSSTGLGLTFCKLAIEAHGGKISVVSNYGDGSTFTFTLPKAHVSASSEQIKDLIVSEEKPLVLSLSKELSELQVYQAGEIFRILNRDEARNLQSPWAHQLRVAVEQSDTDKYRELVELN